VNFLIDWLIAHVIGGLLSKALICWAYHSLVRKVIQWFAFPGSMYWGQRQLEFGQCLQMAQRLNNDCEGYRSSVTFILMNGDRDGPMTEQASHQFILETAEIKAVVKQVTQAFARHKENWERVALCSYGEAGTNGHPEYVAKADERFPISEDQI
jgi:hypothetical protein